uniref:Uncharacterized protein n=1 Tax=Salvator merianae TaxID=96440 RepID=A0A8D0BA15_SALMN
GRRLPRSPVRLDGCSCCLNLGNRNGPGSPLESPLDSPLESPLDSPLGFNNNYDPRRLAVRQSALDPVLREPYALPRQGLCNRNIDQTLLAILLFFHR